MEKTYLTTDDVVKMLGISKQYLYCLRKKKALPYYKFDNKIIYKIDDIIDYIEHKKVQ